MAYRLQDITIAVKMNISFDYLYRDAGNYKLYNSIIFKGITHLPLHIISNTITSNLSQRRYFIPELLNIPRLTFDKYDEDLDHVWHEFDSISETNLQTIDGRNISELIRILRQKPQFLISSDEFLEIEKICSQSR